MYIKFEIFSISRVCNKRHWNAAEMKHELSACILIPTLAGYSTAKVGIKMQELSLCFISGACFSAFYCSPY